VKSPGSKKKVYCSLEQILLQKPVDSIFYLPFFPLSCHDELGQASKPAVGTKSFEDMKLTPQDLISNSYPCDLDNYDKFPQPFDGSKRVVAIDCEMVFPSSLVNYLNV
jgi:hypothetical protein